MPNPEDGTTFQLSVTAEDMAKAGAAVLIRKLKSEFIAYVISFLPAIFAGPFAPIVSLVAGFVFDWVEKQAVFIAYCKYTDIRVNSQGTELSKAIYLEIQAKRGGDKDEITKAEKIADLLFDKFVVIGR